MSVNKKTVFECDVNAFLTKHRQVESFKSNKKLKLEFKNFFFTSLPSRLRTVKSFRVFQWFVANVLLALMENAERKFSLFTLQQKLKFSPWKALFQRLEDINKVLQLLTRGGLRFPWRILHKQHANVHCNNSSLSSFCFSFPQIDKEFYCTYVILSFSCGTMQCTCFCLHLFGH